MKLIFNSSMPRSGSELLQVILHQNPEIYGSPTSPLLEYQFAARANYELPEVRSQNPEQQQKAFLAMCAAMAEGYYSEITDRPVVVDKNRGWAHYYAWVEQWSPNPKMVCCVRDMRSIIASMERAYRKNRHRPTGPDNPAEIRNMTVAQRAEYWLNTQPVGLALQRTLDTFQQGQNDKIHWVRYEDLCNDPQGTMAKVYEYLDMPVYDHDFQNIVKEVQEDDSVYGIFGSHKVSKEIKPVQVGSWSDVLPPDVAASVNRYAQWYQNTFGY